MARSTVIVSLLVAGATMLLSSALVPAATAADDPIPAGSSRTTPRAADGSPMNVLFLVVDDLRPELLAAYGIKNVNVSTPYLDEFSTKALTFRRAYVQQAVCGPSRNSFMSGRRPQNTRVWNFIDNFRKAPKNDAGEEWTALPQFFKEQGYTTYGMGKLYHPGSPPNNDEPKSWTKGFPYYNPGAQIGGCKNKPKGVDNVTCSCDGDVDTGCVDYNLATHAIQTLGKLTSPPTSEEGAATSTARSPWFLGVGLHRPHPDWEVPARFYNAVDPATVQLPKHLTAPKGAPAQAYYSCSYLSGHSDFSGHPILPDSPLPDDLIVKVRRAYYAGVSWMDSQIGRILEALQQSGQANNTIVSFFGDHGWRLGENGGFCKQTNYELTVRIPWLVYDPRSPASHGRAETALVEIVDAYKTLADLAGLPEPEASVDGVSLAPLFAAGSGSTEADAAAAALRSTQLQYAFSQYPRCGPTPRNPGDANWSNPCTQTQSGDFDTMGFTVRSDDWRYTEWRTWLGAKLEADWSAAGKQAVELYDHTGDDGTDFDAFETVNVAGDSGNAGTIATLAAALSAQFAPSALGGADLGGAGAVQS